MTFNEFIAELKASGIKFRTRYERGDEDWTLIRTADDKDECPICALYNFKFPDARVGNAFWKTAAIALDIDEDLGASIVNYADDINMPSHSEFEEEVITGLKSLVKEN